MRLRSFHASPETDIWDTVEDDLQLQLSVHVPSAEGTLSWVLLTAILDAALNEQEQGVADLTPVPALPMAGAIALAVLLLVGGVRRWAAS